MTYPNGKSWALFKKIFPQEPMNQVSGKNNVEIKLFSHLSKDNLSGWC